MDALGGSIGTIPLIKGPLGLPHFKRFMGFLLHRWYIMEKLRRLTHLLINNSKKRDSFGGSKRTPSNSSKEDEKICWFEEEGTWNFRVEFQVGDMVFLRIRPYRQVSLRKGRNEKLWPKFFGSYKALERIGAVAYRLALLESAASISCLLTKEDDRRAYQSTSIDSLYIRKQWIDGYTRQGVWISKESNNRKLRGLNQPGKDYRLMKQLGRIVMNFNNNFLIFTLRIRWL